LIGLHMIYYRIINLALVCSIEKQNNRDHMLSCVPTHGRGADRIGSDQMHEQMQVAAVASASVWCQRQCHRGE